MKFSKLKAINIFLKIHSILIIVAVLTWIIPGNEYLRVVVMEIIFLVFGSIFLILPNLLGRR
jgi:uncharacterized ion transporter superfamily protein YfcC